MLSRMGKRRLVVPEHGEVEPIRLVRGRLAFNPFGPARKAAVPPPVPVTATVPEAVKVEAKAASQPEVPAGRPAEPPLPELAKVPAPIVRTVAGLVRDPKGRPVAGVAVQANIPQPNAPPMSIESAVTDRAGRFVLDALPRRPLQIMLTRPGILYQDEALPPDRDQVELTALLKPDPRDDNPPGPRYDEPIPPGLRERLTFVDLDSRGSDFLADGPSYGGDDLNRLPRGIHKLADTYFRIGEKMVHVQGRSRPDLPESVRGIPVQARGDQLHFLHSTQGGDPEDTEIGAYVIHYSDGSTERIPLVYSREITNWWHRDPGRKLTGAKVAWTGLNDAVAIHVRPGLFVRLFTITWTNPHPEKTIAALDVLSAGKDCDPFLVALTLSRW